jgi:hypothetical protein
MAEKKAEGVPAYMGLRAAAATAYTVATRKSTTDKRKLNQLARIVAGSVPIFSRSAQPEPAPVQPSDIQQGRFEKGGEQLSFGDGRPPIGDLVIRHNQLPMAIAAVREAYRSESG